VSIETVMLAHDLLLLTSAEALRAAFEKLQTLPAAGCTSAPAPPTPEQSLTPTGGDHGCRKPRRASTNAPTGTLRNHDPTRSRSPPRRPPIHRYRKSPPSACRTIGARSSSRSKYKLAPGVLPEERRTASKDFAGVASSVAWVGAIANPRRSVRCHGESAAGADVA
jgi:hypothetical protein